MRGSARSTPTARRRAPGVLAVLTAADVAADGLKSLRPYVEANVQTGEQFVFDAAAAAGRRQGPLSSARPVALVVAETPRPGARRRRAGRGRLRAAAGGHDRPMPPRAPARRNCRPRCRAISASTGGPATPTARRGRLRRAPRMSSRSTSTTTASSPTRWSRAARSALFDPASGRYTLHVSSQSIHANRDHAARALGVEPSDAALHRARCRRRLRRQELHLCRARAGRPGRRRGSAGR